MSEFKRITGLWLRDGKNGKFMSGKVAQEVTIPAGAQLFVFKNTRKDRDGDPDYTVNVAPPREQQGGGGTSDEFY